MWVTQGKQIEDMGAHSVCIKDMAGLLTPYDAYNLVSQLKKSLSIPVHLHCHATTGLSVATLLKAAEAGVDNVDTAISSMSMTYGHSPTETIVAALSGQPRDTELQIKSLEDIAAYFRDIRKKYAQFEGNLKGVDSRILVSQVPGGMLTNMESQLKEQGAADRFDEVLAEIPRVREDLGFLPLVTPTSQIVGSQAVINILTGERYKTITKESAGVLKGEYGATPAPVNKALQDRVLEGATPITCRPADLLAPEMAKLIAEVKAKAQTEQIKLSDNIEEDALINGMFAQIGWKFIANRGKPDAFEPAPSKAPAKPVTASQPNATESYSVNVDGRNYNVVVAPGGAGLVIQQPAETEQTSVLPTVISTGEVVRAPMAGNILKINVAVGSVVKEGDVVVIMEAMKMETEVRVKNSGTVTALKIKEGAAVAVGDALITL
jgi:oxaloacetate decarboxylase alpha subunit